MAEHIKRNDVFAEMTCCICGRVFIPAVEHVFRVSGQWCCTYPCYIKLQAEIETQKAIERARKIAARKAKARERARRREQAAAPSKNETSVEMEGEGNGN